MPQPVAFAYEHVYPESVGGAQRYYWALTRELARRRPVVLLCARLWDGPEGEVERDGVRVIGISREDGAFRLALGAHLARRGGRYGAVHVGCFPPGAALAARLALLRHRTPLLVDWHEVLPRDRWLALFGVRGNAGYVFQRLSMNAGPVAVTFSDLHAQRLRGEGRRGEIAKLPEFLPEGDPGAGAATGERENLVVSIGRLEPEKHADVLPHVVAQLRRRDPSWRGIVFGDGPHRPAVERAVADAGVPDAVDVPGFTPWETVAAALDRARVLLFPTEREGFGLVVLEAAAHGVPSVLVAGPHNAATELIEPGRNGVVCGTRDPAELAAAVLEAASGAASSRTREWFDEASHHLSVRAAADAHEALWERLGVR